MPRVSDIVWFKQQFGRDIEAAVHGTPFNLDMLTAVACQETGYIWQVLRERDLSVNRILELCVGDTLDANKGRRAFPRTKADLVAKPNGGRMFEIAREGLVEMARHVKDYRATARMPNKFCHGFGIFQFDLQFFLQEPDYFLEKRYADINQCTAKAVGELRNALRRVGLQDKAKLTDFEMASVAIAYNTGRFIPSKGLKQGHFNGSKFYGEQFFDFLRLAKSVVVDISGATSPVVNGTTGTPVVTPAPTHEVAPGVAPLPPPSPVEATGTLYEVDVRSNHLRLRREPKIDARRPNANVLARLPDGHIVRAVTNKKVGDFLEIETSLLGAHLRGFAWAQFLKRAKGVDDVPIVSPAVAPPTSSIVAVEMPRRAGTITTRTGLATAHSLNETGQPVRKGTTPDELRAELAAIINWLAVDKPAHARYQPRNRVTFCNIYAHDYCRLAGVYLPRVWWTPGAIESLAQGKTVAPLLGSTIDEQRANDLFRWLRDFGSRFGWRRTGTLSSLQLEVNQGAIGIIVARRKADGLSGHIVAVVPETNELLARRNREVIAPLQSQAGLSNFRYGTGTLNWWLDERFADSAFWLHA